MSHYRICPDRYGNSASGLFAYFEFLNNKCWYKIYYYYWSETLAKVPSSFFVFLYFCTTFHSPSNYTGHIHCNESTYRPYITPAFIFQLLWSETLIVLSTMNSNGTTVQRQTMICQANRPDAGIWESRICPTTYGNFRSNTRMGRFIPGGSLDIRFSTILCWRLQR